MFCTNCGSQTDNVDAICDTCRSSQTIHPEQTTSATPSFTQSQAIPAPTPQNQSIPSQVGTTSSEPTPMQQGQPIQPGVPSQALTVASVLENANKFVQNNSFLSRFTKEELVNAGILSGIAAVISFVFSVILSLIVNTAAKNYIAKLTANIFDLSAFGEGSNILSPYLLWRLSFLNSFSVKTIGTGNANILISIRFLILLIIPFLSFWCAWYLVENPKIRESLPTIFKQKEFSIKPKEGLRINLIITAIYGVIFALSSFIPITLMKRSMDLFDLNIKLTYHLTFFSSLIHTAIVVFAVNMIIGFIKKSFTIQDLELDTPINLHTEFKTFLHIYKNYLLNSIVITIALFLVVLFKENLWKQILLIVTMLPNIILMVMNVLIGRTLNASSSGDSISIFKNMSTQSNFALILLVIVFIGLLIYAMVQGFQKLDKTDSNKFWTQVAKITGMVILAQALIYYITRISMKASVMGVSSNSMSISVNILVLVILLAIIGAVSGVITLYLPANLLKYVQITDQKQEANPVTKMPNQKDLIIMASLFVFTLLLGFIGLSNGGTKSTSSSSRLNEITYSGNSNITDPSYISAFNNGYAYYDSGNYYFYSKNQLTKLKLDSSTLDGNLIFSSTEDKILVDSGSTIMVVNGSGKELYKQEVSYDSLLTISKDFNHVAFWFNDELTIYNSKKNEFVILNTKVTTAKPYSGTASFGSDAQTLYMISSNLVSYQTASGEEKLITDVSPSFEYQGRDLYVYEVDSTIPVSIEDGSALIYGYLLDNNHEYYDIVNFKKDDNEDRKVCLSNISNVSTIDNGNFLLTFKNSSDTFIYDANSDRLTNISAEIRYLSMKSSAKGGK